MSTPMGCGGGRLHVILVVSIGVRGVVKLSIITTTSSGWEFMEYWLQHHKQETYVLQSQIPSNVLNLAEIFFDW
jgi:hypothetical protein